MGFTLEVENYRALRKVRWSPSGVCAITGPNGSGKTTLLSVIEFLRHFLQRGNQAAVEFSGGTASIRNQHAGITDAIRFTLLQQNCFWMVQAYLTPPSLEISEGVWLDQQQLANRDIFSSTASVLERKLIISGDSVFSHAMSLLPTEQREALKGLHELASNFRLYQNLQSGTLRTVGSPSTADLYLHTDGRNAFSVLRNWKAGRKEHEERWRFVRDGLEECFPELFEDIEFLSAGQTVTVRFFFKGLQEPIDAYSAPHGLLITLLHLCAIASTPDGGAAAIDEPENGLHPYAIRTLMDLARARASAKDLTLLLATHSPVVLNTFNTEPERVYIMEPGHDVLPIALSEHSNPEWLAHFSLGDLYSDQTFGAQRRPPK
ncbi:MAG TPA: AAA family ATPase [Archangium sp.]|uniref:AAA family ATPase n=1 Tax=Archangium sp. TaxID=1872627 RepID=UPI002E34E083|nr:AAA family ATPase [Archangium sp.]HEX5752932.1 AAA family ATPase [Archangium sp.]